MGPQIKPEVGTELEQPVREQGNEERQTIEKIEKN